MRNSRFILGVVALVLATGLLKAQVATNVGQGAKKWDGGPGFPLHPDQATELAMKIKQPFTIVGVGDLLQFQPFAKNLDPDIQFFVKLLQSADVTIGDLENEIFDFDNFGHYRSEEHTSELQSRGLISYAV